MSSLTVLCPNGQRQKVATTPNMAMLQVLETVCTKKKLDPSKFRLQHHRKTIDLSNTVRFSGLPNNAQLELIELKEGEEGAGHAGTVTVCIQVPSGERVVDQFTSETSLKTVLEKFKDSLGNPQEDESPVVVYMRREVIGWSELEGVSLRNLGLISGKGLFRFFYKKPELLKEQANVYDMKEKTPEVKERRYMAPKQEDVMQQYLQTEKAMEERRKSETVKSETPDNSEKAKVQSASQPYTAKDQETTSTPVDYSKQQQQPPEPATESEPVPGPSSVNQTEAMEDSRSIPDSTTSQDEESLINPVGPNEAIIFPVESSSGRSMRFEDIDDSFFELQLEDVKGLYRDLKLAVKDLEEGGALLTKDMREARKEGEKLELLGRYKQCVLRIQMPSRHVVQGIFLPGITIGEVKDWLRPLLVDDTMDFELYTAPPRTVLPVDVNLLDLLLCPAALIHFSGKDRKVEDDLYLKKEHIEELSNLSGANEAASIYRKSSARRRIQETNMSSGSQESRPSKRPPGTTSEEYVGGQSTGSKPQAKLPRWFKPGK